MPLWFTPLLFFHIIFGSSDGKRNNREDALAEMARDSDFEEETDDEAQAA